MREQPGDPMAFLCKLLGGDQGTAEAPAKAVEDLAQLRRQASGGHVWGGSSGESHLESSEPRVPSLTRSDFRQQWFAERHCLTSGPSGTVRRRWFMRIRTATARPKADLLGVSQGRRVSFVSCRVLRSLSIRLGLARVGRSQGGISELLRNKDRRSDAFSPIPEP